MAVPARRREIRGPAQPTLPNFFRHQRDLLLPHLRTRRSPYRPRTFRHIPTIPQRPQLPQIPTKIHDRRNLQTRSQIQQRHPKTELPDQNRAIHSQNSPTHHPQKIPTSQLQPRSNPIFNPAHPRYPSLPNTPYNIPIRIL
jgi:hypothetical protein